jgi:hypothetical protein
MIDALRNGFFYLKYDGLSFLFYIFVAKWGACLIECKPNTKPWKIREGSFRRR